MGLLEEKKVTNYFFSAGAAWSAGAGAWAEVMGAWAGAGAGAACSAGAGAGASSFFLQPAAKATAIARHSVRESSFFIDVFTSFPLELPFSRGAHGYLTQRMRNILALEIKSRFFYTTYDFVFSEIQQVSDIELKSILIFTGSGTQILCLSSPPWRSECPHARDHSACCHHRAYDRP